uniref:Uracil phosphoribosyltransferase n=1 Tax=Crouania attenuata TaxID=42002 RepID=A0A4D6WV57_9FLOR|nr:hypothetical protein [Crouania attenuata]
MQLNIYLLSHPLIKQISSSILDIKYIESLTHINTTSLKEYYSKTLGIFLIYESMRKWINLNKFYLKKLNQVQEIYIVSPKEKYIMITDIIKNYQIIGDIKIMIPEIQFIHLNSEYINTHSHLFNEEIKKYNISIHTNIILLQTLLNDHVILKYINILKSKSNVMTKKIHILCFTCNNKILDRIGQIYPELNIYTTQIINN